MFSIISAVSIFFADQYLKKKVEVGELRDGEELFGGKVVVEKSYNKGFLLNHCETQPKWVLAISSAVFGALFYLYLMTLGRKRKSIKRFGLALSLGGAASNLYDRIQKDRVTDYAVIKGIKGFIVNVGDLFIFLGTLIAFIGDLFGRD